MERSRVQIQVKTKETGEIVSYVSYTLAASVCNKQFGDGARADHISYFLI